MIQTVAILTLSLLGLLSPVLANSILFYNAGPIDLQICFTPNSNAPNDGSWNIPQTSVPGGASVTVNPAPSWSGSFHAVPASGDCDLASTFGGITFQGYENLSYYDVDASSAPTGDRGIHFLYPAKGGTDAEAGCYSFPCSEAFYPGESATPKTTTQTDFVCDVWG